MCSLHNNEHGPTPFELLHSALRFCRDDGILIGCSLAVTKRSVSAFSIFVPKAARLLSAKSGGTASPSRHGGHELKCYRTLLATSLSYRSLMFVKSQQHIPPI